MIVQLDRLMQKWHFPTFTLLSSPLCRKEAHQDRLLACVLILVTVILAACVTVLIAPVVCLQVLIIV
jgi:hypothetical protein